MYMNKLKEKLKNPSKPTPPQAGPQPARWVYFTAIAAFHFIPNRKRPIPPAVSLLGTSLSFLIPEPVQDLQTFNNSKNKRINVSEQGENPFPAKEACYCQYPIVVLALTTP